MAGLSGGGRGCIVKLSLNPTQAEILQVAINLLLDHFDDCESDVIDALWINQDGPKPNGNDAWDAVNDLYSEAQRQACADAQREKTDAEQLKALRASVRRHLAESLPHAHGFIEALSRAANATNHTAAYVHPEAQRAYRCGMADALLAIRQELERRTNEAWDGLANTELACM